MALCRMFALVGSKEESQKNYEEKMSLIKDILTSWGMAAENDPLLQKVCPKKWNVPPAHKHGWGVLVWTKSFKNCIHINYKRSEDPLKLKNIEGITENIAFQLQYAEQYVIIGHARLASPNTPLSIDQVHPFLLELEAFETVFFLQHNGTINKQALNRLLTKPYDNETLEQRSDTQLLTEYMKGILQEEEPTRETLLTALKKVIEEHITRNLYWSGMQLILGILPLNLNSVPKVWYFSCANPDYEPQNSLCPKDFDLLWGYLELFYGKSTTTHIIASSTVKHYFESIGSENITWKNIVNMKMGEFVFKADEISLDSTSFNID